MSDSPAQPDTITTDADVVPDDRVTDDAPRGREKRLLIALGLVGLLMVIGLGGFAIFYDAGEPEGITFVIPEGAAAELDYPTIDTAIDVPNDIRLEKGQVLTIRNEDTAANRAGPWVLAGGETLRMRFDTTGEFFYLCTVDEDESVTVTVVDSLET